jgi:hypothetical protein
MYFLLLLYFFLKVLALHYYLFMQFSFRDELNGLTVCFVHWRNEVKSFSVTGCSVLNFKSIVTYLKLHYLSTQFLLLLLQDHEMVVA